mmetsp:Transcript_43272/g.140366  ORF Transcript_43272/g.140366 Transcript_43272/m.140366 type:complete len:82 (-) Transcript_43272:269-514(-)
MRRWWAGTRVQRMYIGKRLRGLRRAFGGATTITICGVATTIATTIVNTVTITAAAISSVPAAPAIASVRLIQRRAVRVLVE